MDNSNKKPIILVTSTYFAPGNNGGGTPRSLMNLFARTKDRYDYWLITGDRDPGGAEPYPGVALDCWRMIDGIHVYYLSRGQATLSGWIDLARSALPPYDLLYLNSFFSPRFSIWPLVLRKLGMISDGKPVLVAPRGELSPGALGVKRHKKMAYRFIASSLGLYRNLHWQASSEQEADYIRNNMGSPKQIAVARDLSTKYSPLHSAKPVKSSGALRLVFLSRVSPVKNLDYLLDLLSKVNGAVEFDIYGPIADEKYWQACLRKMVALPGHIKAQYRGSIPYTQITATLRAYDFFVLLSQGENFGHAIWEALTAGCPVLISDQTPWQSLDVHQAGWVVSLKNENRIIQVLQAMVDMSDSDYCRLTRCVEEYVRQSEDEVEHIDAHHRMFSAVMETRNR